MSNWFIWQITILLVVVSYTQLFSQLLLEVTLLKFNGVFLCSLALTMISCIDENKSVYKKKHIGEREFGLRDNEKNTDLLHNQFS